MRLQLLKRSRNDCFIEKDLEFTSPINYVCYRAHKWGHSEQFIYRFTNLLTNWLLIFTKMKRRATERFPIVGLELAPELDTEINVEGKSMNHTVWNNFRSGCFYLGFHLAGPSDLRFIHAGTRQAVPTKISMLGLNRLRTKVVFRAFPFHGDFFSFAVNPKIRDPGSQNFQQ